MRKQRISKARIDLLEKEDPWLNREQVAFLLKVSRNHMNKLVKDNVFDVPAIEISPRKRFYPLSQVQAWIARRPKTEATGAAR